MEFVQHDNVYQALRGIMSDLGAVEKIQKGGLGYHFRGIDQALFHLQPLLVKHGVIMAPSYMQHTQTPPPNGGKMTRTLLELVYTFTLVGNPESQAVFSAMGEGLDHSDKGIAKAYSVALKNLVWQLFCVPTEDRVDNDDEDAKEETTKKAPSKSKAPKTAKKSAELCTDEDRSGSWKLAEARGRELGITSEDAQIEILKEAMNVFAPGKKFNQIPKSELSKIKTYIENWTVSEPTLTPNGLKALHAWAGGKKPEGWGAHEWLHAGADLLGHDSLAKIPIKDVAKLKTQLLQIEDWPEEAPSDIKKRAVFDAE